MAELKVCDICGMPLKGVKVITNNAWYMMEQESYKHLGHSTFTMTKGKEEIDPELCEVCMRSLATLYKKWKEARLRDISSLNVYIGGEKI